MEDPPSAALRHWNHTLNLHNLNRFASRFARTSCFSTITNQTGTTATG